MANSLFSYVSHQEISWERTDLKTLQTFVLDDNSHIDETSTVDVDTSLPQGWTGTIALQPNSLYDIDLDALPVQAFGRTINKSINLLQGIAIVNQSLDTISVGSSGVDDITFLGFSVPIGPSGLFQYNAPSGIDLLQYGFQFGVYNPTDDVIEAQVAIVGQFSSLTEFSNDFSNDFS